MSNGEDNKPKVIKLKGAKIKKTGGGDGINETIEDPKKKYTAAIVDEILFNYFNAGERLHFVDRVVNPPNFNLWFYRESHLSASRCVKIENGLATELNRDQVRDLINKELRKFAIPGDSLSLYAIGFQRIKQLAETLFISGRKLPRWPKPISFLNDQEPSFEKFLFNPAKGEFPFIKKTLSNISNSKALCIRIGSFYDENASRKQAFWVYGKGDGGKTTLFKLLSLLVGEQGVAPFDDSLKSDPFGVQSLVDKRLWIGEEISPKFIRTSFFKRITGGSTISVNPKGKERFNATLKGFMFFNSNEAPDIPSDSGLLNRLIVCKCETIPMQERLPSYEVLERFRNELPEFIGYCIDLYQRTSNKNAIQANTEELEAAVDMHESLYENIFDALFVEDYSLINRGILPVRDFRACYEGFLSENPSYRQSATWPEFQAYVKSRLNLNTISKLTKIGGKVIRTIPGIRKI